MLARSLVAVGWMGLASLAISAATAEDASAPAIYAVEGISLSDRQAADSFGPRFNLNVRDSEGGAFAPLSSTRGERSADGDSLRRIEVGFVARGADAGLPLDVAIAQRASVTVDENGDISRQRQGAELRLGRGLSMARRDTAGNTPAIYLFAASDDEALTWQPGARSAFGGAASSFALQDRVEIGDLQAGVTYERGGVQASLAYVEREVSVHSGSRSFTQDENFAGLTVTMRR